MDSHKRLSSEVPLAEAEIPARLIVPLLRRGGPPMKAVVAIGDSLARGEVIAGGGDYLVPPVHAASSGVVTQILDLPLDHSSGLNGPCVVIETDGEDRSVAMPAIADYRACSSATLRERIHQAGIVGLGGAGFPAAAKLGSGRCVDTLVLNGVECEPYITCDDSLMRHRPDEVLSGAEILMHILGVQRCLLAVEDDMPEAITALRAARQRRDRAGVTIVPVPAIYPAGGERQLIETLTGRRAPSGGFPPDIGVVCHNVGTAAAVFRAVVHGEPLTSRIVTVTGRGIRTPRNLVTRIGTRIADLIAQCGAYTGDAERLILGGPMMGHALRSDEVPITCTDNCILVAAAGELPAKGRALPCIRCGACAEVCPAALLPQQLYWYARSSHLQRAEDDRLFDCIECGCCDVVCPSHIPLTQQFRTTKSEVLAKRREHERAGHARLRFEARQRRRERQQLQRTEEVQRKKEALIQPGATEIAAAIQRAKSRKAGARAGSRSGANERPDRDDKDATTLS